MASFRFAYTMQAAVLLSGCLIGETCRGEESLRVEAVPQTEAERTIAAKLQQPLSWSFQGEPLEMISGLLSERGIPHAIEHPMIENADLDVSKPVVLNVKDITLESMLNLLLNPLELDWTIRNEAVVITTRESLIQDLETRVYPVADLVAVQEGDEVYEDYDDLIQIITTIIDPATWDDVGGPGSIAAFEASSALVISQTRKSHERVEALLRALRQARDDQPNVAARSSRQVTRAIISERRKPAVRTRVYARPPAWATPRSHEQHLSEREPTTTLRQSIAR